MSSRKNASSAVAQDEPIHRLPPVFRGPSTVVLPMAGEVNWGMKTFLVDKLREITDGEGVAIGGVDTGIDDTHPDIAPNFKKAKDFTGSQYGYRDRHGHGTHIAGTNAARNSDIGVAYKAPIYHGKGLGDSGSGGNGLISAMEWCISEGCEVLSCSWGGGGQSQAWETRFREWNDRGIWMIFAGGNSGAGTADSDWPGRSPNLINVAALNMDLSPASFSSAGEKLDTAGPGVNIWSCRPGGGYQQMSGTSMATPFVAGVLSLFRKALKLRNLPIPKTEELRQLLVDKAMDVHTPGDDRRTGPGPIHPLLLALSIDAPVLDNSAAGFTFETSVPSGIQTFGALPSVQGLPIEQFMEIVRSKLSSFSFSKAIQVGLELVTLAKAYREKNIPAMLASIDRIMKLVGGI